MSATLVKICGLTRPADAAHAAQAGADFLGLNFWPRSKRFLPVASAPAVAAAARDAGSARLVGVFVDASASEIAATVRAVGLDLVQVHGDETPADLVVIAAATGVPVWKALGIAGPADVADLSAWLVDGVDALLLDTATPGRGGSGTSFDWTLAAEAARRTPGRRLVLAGGLTAATVASAIAVAAPWAVDVASGVESAPGVKDAAAVTAFVAAVRSGATTQRI